MTDDQRLHDLLVEAAELPANEIGPPRDLLRRARRRRIRLRSLTFAASALAVAVAVLVSTLALGPGAEPRAVVGPASGANSGAPHPASGPPPASPAASLDRPAALAIAGNGDVLISDQGTNQVLRRTPTGSLAVLAGTGRAGYAGDGGPAGEAELDRPGGLAVAANGTVYIADTGNNRVRAVSPTGVITTVAGNGHDGSGGTGGPAVAADLPGPTAVALDRRGQLYVVDDNGVQLVSASGTLTTLVPAGPGRLSISGVAVAFDPTAIAIGDSGQLYVADFSPKLLLELTPAGHVLAAWPVYVTPAGLTTAPDGSVLVANYAGFAVDRIANGRRSTLVTFSRGSLRGVTGTFRPSGVAVNSAGRVYAVTDGVNGGTDRPALVTISGTGQASLLPTGPSTHL